MAAIEWVRFLAGGALLLVGMAIFIIEMIGVFRFRYVLNRMQAAAMGDTLGLGSCLLGLMVISGLNFTSLKLFLVIVFLWFSSPVSSYLIARLEVTTDEEKDKHYRRISLEEGQAGSRIEASGREWSEESAAPGREQSEESAVSGREREKSPVEAAEQEGGQAK